MGGERSGEVDVLTVQDYSKGPRSGPAWSFQGCGQGAEWFPTSARMPSLRSSSIRETLWTGALGIGALCLAGWWLAVNHERGRMEKFLTRLEAAGPTTTEEARMELRGRSPAWIDGLRRTARPPASPGWRISRFLERAEPGKTLARLLPATWRPAPGNPRVPAARRVAAIRALGWLGPEAGTAATDMGWLTLDPDCNVAEAAVRALPRVILAPDECLAIYRVVLRQRACDDARTAVMETLQPPGIGAGAEIALLVGGLNDAQAAVRSAAANALGRWGRRAGAAAPRLDQLLEDPLPGVRMSGAQALARLGDHTPARIHRIANLLVNDPDEGVRREAARALGMMGPDAAPELNALVRAVRDPQPGVRLNAIEALGLLGPAAGSSVPALEAARNNDPSGVGLQVATALEKIGVQIAPDVGQKNPGSGTSETP